MKLYISPSERDCPANCIFCITKFRNETCFGDMLKLEDLYQLDEFHKKYPIEYVEITGGGDPFDNKNIMEIIDFCLERWPTQVYTNAYYLSSDICNSPEFVEQHIDKFRRLRHLCVSRHHWTSTLNRKIMGISSYYSGLKNYYSLDQFFLTLENKTKIKLSLVLCKSGIANWQQLKAYLDWANNLKIEEVVVRQMFDQLDKNHHELTDIYPKIIAEEFCDAKEIINDLDIDYHLDDNGNPHLRYRNVNVEFDIRNCPCEVIDPVLRSNGKIYKGWGYNEF